MSDNENKSREDHLPIPLGQVLSEELQQLRGQRPTNEDLHEVLAEMNKHDLTALCFSGGGIRSATFGLGVVQALAKHKRLVNFDYLSTVSGGGYLGSWLSAWIYRVEQTIREKGAKAGQTTAPPPGFGVKHVQDVINCAPLKPGTDKPNMEPTPLQYLREYSNYMSPKTGLLSADTWALIAIYLRNLSLNLTIFIPLIAGVLMLPRILFRAVGPPDPSATSQLWMLIFAMVAGSGAVAFVVSRLPSKISAKDEEGSENAPTLTAFQNTDAGVLLFGVAPLLLAAFLTTTLWAWTYRSVGKLQEISYLNFSFGLGEYRTLIYFGLATVVAFSFGLLLFFIIRFRRAAGFSPWWAFSALFSSVLGGLLLWLVTYQLFPWVAELTNNILGDNSGLEWLIYQSLAVPMLLLIVLVCATIFVGLTSFGMTDEDREWLARYGAWVLIVGVAWISLNVLVLIAPWAAEWMFSTASRQDLTSLSGITAVITSLTTILSGVISLAGGFSEKSAVHEDEPRKTWTSRFFAVAPRIAAVIFLISIFVFLAYMTSVLLYLLGGALGPTGLGPFPESYAHLDVLAGARLGYLFLVLAALSLIGLFMACFVNVNKFSLHGAYRDRLVRAYLGASNPNRKRGTFSGFDDSDNLELHWMAGQKPLHIINAAVNLVGGKNLAWQNRKAASFMMSPLHCGSWAVGGYRRASEYGSNPISRRALRLGTAMAISGAAANPNMGYYSSSVVTFLMALFNIRLGWWLGNTGPVGSKFDWFGKHRFYQKSSPSIAVLPLLNETLGRTDEARRFLNLSDGGHFENLALYEMVLRRCRFIVLSDGAADMSFKFGEIANAIQKCKVDLGVDIKLLGEMNIRGRKGKEKGDVQKSRFAIAEITYPEVGSKGWLLYTRPAYYKTEPRDIVTYADCNEHFPHQSTGDQMYDEKQFEAYRGLGFFTVEEVLRRLSATLKNEKGSDFFEPALRELLIQEPHLCDTLSSFLDIKPVLG